MDYKRMGCKLLQSMLSHKTNYVPVVLALNHLTDDGKQQKTKIKIPQWPTNKTCNKLKTSITTLQCTLRWQKDKKQGSLALASMREMIRPQAAWRPQAARRQPAAWRPQCAVKWDQNLKPKLAIMRQCSSITADRHWHHSISARCIYYILH